MNTKKAEKVLLQVAKKNGVSVEEVRREIDIAISEARINSDPAVQEFWNSLAYKGAEPTPEEVITYIAKKVRK